MRCERTLSINETVAYRYTRTWSIEVVQRRTAPRRGIKASATAPQLRCVVFLARLVELLTEAVVEMVVETSVLAPVTADVCMLAVAIVVDLMEEVGSCEGEDIGEVGPARVVTLPVIDGLPDPDREGAMEI
jgi:hypothetical protein